MKALHHTFLLLTGKGLDFFIPKWARPSRDLFKGENMMKAELGSIDEMGLLRFEPWQDCVCGLLLCRLRRVGS